MVRLYLKKLGEEQPLVPETPGPIAEAPAICWSYGRTIGNIALFSPSLLGRFAGQVGDDAQLPCDFVYAGKFRHGSERWWCRTHQTYWGTKADQESLEQFGEIRCANHTQPVREPYTVDELRGVAPHDQSNRSCGSRDLVLNAGSAFH